VRQAPGSELSPQVCAALDNLSLSMRKPTYCHECGRVMIAIDAQLWTYGGNRQWNIKLALCAECDSEAIRTIPVTLAA
jgi:hypothetical protein